MVRFPTQLFRRYMLDYTRQPRREVCGTQPVPASRRQGLTQVASLTPKRHGHQMRLIFTQPHYLVI